MSFAAVASQLIHIDDTLPLPSVSMAFMGKVLPSAEALIDEVGENPGEWCALRLPAEPCFEQPFLASNWVDRGVRDLLLGTALMGKLPEVRNVAVLRTDAEGVLETLGDKGVCLIWDGTGQCDGRCVLARDAFSYRKDDAEFAGSFAIPIPRAKADLALRALARNCDKDFAGAIAQPVCWALQHIMEDEGHKMPEACSRWGLGWADPRPVMASLCFPGFDLHEAEVLEPYGDDEVLLDVLAPAADTICGIFSRDIWDKSTPMYAIYSAYVEKCQQIYDIWMQCFDLSRCKPGEWEAFVSQAVGSLVSKDPLAISAPDRMTQLLVELGMRAGVDSAMEAYAEGVPIEMLGSGRKHDLEE